MSRGVRRAAALALATALAAGGLAACGARTAGSSYPSTTGRTAPDPTPRTIPTAGSTASPTAGSTSVPTASPTTSPTRRPALGTVPPAWLGTRPLPLTSSGYGAITPTPPELRDRRFTLPDTLPELPGDGFASRITSPAPADVIARSTWQPSCPVAASDLAWIRLTFRGFDGARHTGELLVSSTVADDVVTVFEDLWKVGFPIEEMRITTRAQLDAAPTGDGNDTGAFVCRPVVTSTIYSQHAYGLAIDLNPFQNPFREQRADGQLVLPELASSYTRRAHVRPGMILPDGTAVRAFSSIGWTWGGTWTTKQDFQHFSLTGG